MTSDLICGKVAVGGNYNSTRDNLENRQDDVIKSVADYVGKLIGHVLFK